MAQQMKFVFHLFGMILAVEGLCMLLCLPASYHYGGSDAHAIILSSGITFCVGALLFLVFRKHPKHINKRIAFFTVTFIWIIASCFGTLPYLLSETIPDFSGAFVEAMSGFTTTGASVIPDIEVAPKGIVFWRSLSQWIGGMGMIVLVVAFVPFLGINSMSLYSAEVSGPSKDKIHPHLITSARRIWLTYAIMTFGTIIFLIIGGMNLFEAFTHAFSAVSSGGFGIKSDGVASYPPFAQYVLAISMIVAAWNYSLNYFLLKGRIKSVLKDEEWRIYLSIILISSILVIAILHQTTNYGWEESIRHGFFQVASVASTTGFVSADYTLWAPAISFIFLILMFGGGMAGSTAGGIKIIRIVILFKNCRHVLANIVHPKAVLPIRMNKKILSENAIGNALAFFLIYVGVFVAGTLALILSGVDAVEAMGAAITAMCSYGPGFGESGGFGNYIHFSHTAQWIFSALMLVGRLELMTVLILFFPPYWKK